MNEIEEKLKELATRRQDLETTKKELESKKIDLQLTPEWLAVERFTRCVNEDKEAIEALEVEIKLQGTMAFLENPTLGRKPVKGIEVKEFSIIKVLDEKKALIWASQNAPSILKLDQTKFKKAVENLELDFVEKGVEYRTQIASDLSEYLK